MTPKVKETLDKILACFESGNIPQSIAYSMFPIPHIPCAAWSLMNRTLVFLSGTMDARGFKQWNSVNRYVKKGSKALYILVPYIKRIEDDNNDCQFKLTGFGACPVFRVEDTDGEPLEYQDIELPELPLMDRARDWGISIKAIPGNYRYYGYYAPNRKEIALATNQEDIFFHELAHVAHHKIQGYILPVQDLRQEVVAELSACALARMVGKSLADTTGNHYHSIKQYADQFEMSVHCACLRVLSDTEKVLNLIIHNNIEGEETTACQKAA